MKPPSLKKHIFNNSSQHIYYNQPNQAADKFTERFSYLFVLLHLKIAGIGNGLKLPTFM